VSGPLYTDSLFSGTITGGFVTIHVPVNERWVILEVLYLFGATGDIVESVIPATGAPLFLGIGPAGANNFLREPAHTVVPAGSAIVIIASGTDGVTLSGWKLTIP
jgi:hypothetical protein